MRILCSFRNLHDACTRKQFGKLKLHKLFSTHLGTRGIETQNDDFKEECDTYPGTTHYNIVIAGGGMVGTTLACTLGKNRKLANKNILLLEASKSSTWQVSDDYSNRVVALNPQTVNLFKRIDAWKHISRFGIVKQLHVWDALSDSMINFEHDDMNAFVACIVENDLLLNAAQEELKNVANVTVINEAKVKQCVIHKQPNIVLLSDDSSYTCDLLLGCDGANSRVREALGAQYLNWSYEQCGVVATLELATTEDNFVAWQRFLPEGPIALLPLTENLSSLVWSTTPDHARSLLELPAQEFVNACNEAFCRSYNVNFLVGEARKLTETLLNSLNMPTNNERRLPPQVVDVAEGSRASFPLSFGHATNYVAEGVALVGDAAHKVHPLAGQGVNLGFGDVETLNRIAGEAIYNGSQIYHLDYLAQYETERQRHNVPTMLTIEGIHRLYNTQLAPFVILRSIGLQVAQALAPLKKMIIAHASS